MTFLSLERYTRKRAPFDYLTSNHMFTTDVYTLLRNEFPAKHAFKGEGTFSNNNRYDFNLEDLQNSDGLVSDLWKEVIEEMTSLAFFKKLCDEFEVDGSKFERILYRQRQRADSQSLHENEVMVDLQLCYNVKNEDQSAVFLRLPHVDSPDKLFVILIYFPDCDECDPERDRGELLLYDSKVEFKQTYIGYKAMMNDLTVVDKVLYDHNTGIIFKNSNRAVHGPMSLINRKDKHRRFLNVVFMIRK